MSAISNVQQISTKYCPGCEKTKSLSLFHKNIQNASGYRSRCKECTKKYEVQRCSAAQAILQKNKENEQMQSNDKKFCPGCKIFKEINEFHKNKGSIHGFQSYCKKCSADAQIERKSQLENFLKYSYSTCKDNCKRRSKSLLFEITVQDIIELYNCQNGKCKLSNLDMTYIADGTKTCGQINPYNISIDRIDNQKGYIEGNVQLICSIINLMRGDLPIGLFMDYLKLIKDGPKSYSLGLTNCDLLPDFLEMPLPKTCGIKESLLPSVKYAQYKDIYDSVIFNSFLKSKFKDLKDRAIKKDLIVDIDINDIKNKCGEQQFTCAITGKSMAHIIRRREEDDFRHILNDENISVNRINSSIGYSIDNIQLVLSIVNRIKFNLSDENLIKLSSIIVKHHEQQKHTDILPVLLEEMIEG